MRKTNYLLMTFSVAMITFFSSCEKKLKDNEGDDPIGLNPIAEGAVCYKDNGRPNNMLTYKEIVAMLTQYDKTRTKVLKHATPKNVEDTRMNTYKINELRDYLAYIENLCKEKQIELTGINIISSVYPTNYHIKEYADKQTLIFMPVTKIDGENVTFDPLQSSKGKPTTFKELLHKFGYDWKYDAQKIKFMKEQKAGVFSMDIQQDLKSSGSNKTQVTPPPY